MAAIFTHAQGAAAVGPTAVRAFLVKLLRDMLEACRDHLLIIVVAPDAQMAFLSEVYSIRVRATVRRMVANGLHAYLLAGCNHLQRVGLFAFRVCFGQLKLVRARRHAIHRAKGGHDDAAAGSFDTAAHKSRALVIVRVSPAVCVLGDVAEGVVAIGTVCVHAEAVPLVCNVGPALEIPDMFALFLFVEPVRWKR